MLYFRGLLGQTDSCSADGACPSATRHSSASASVNLDTETSDIYDETWLESTIKVDDHKSNGANEMTEKKSSSLYKYVFTRKHKQRVTVIGLSITHLATGRQMAS